LDAVDDEWNSAPLSDQSAEILEEWSSKGFFEPGVPVPGGKDDMIDQVCEGVRHVLDLQNHVRATGQDLGSSYRHASRVEKQQIVEEKHLQLFSSLLSSLFSSTPCG